MISLRHYMIRFLRFLIDVASNVIFRLAYGKSQSLPPIANDILLQSATNLALKIRKKQLKSVDVVKAYISRIRAVQPILNAVVDERFQGALEEAQRTDDFIDSGTATEEAIERETPLLGIPFSCKEAIAVQGMLFTSGLVSRKGKRAEEDSEAVQQLRRAGAIPLVVTNVPELCMWWETSNYLYGTTNNPYDTNRISGGSSGGEGALIAAAGSIIGIGNDIGGSIRIPSFMNGVHGHKPSTGIVSNKGQYPVAEGMLDSILVTGPMCRYAVDLMILMKVLSGKKASLLNLDKPVNLHRMKMYYMDDDGGNPFLSPVGSDLKRALQKVLRHFEETYDISSQRVKFESLRDAFSIWVHKLAEADAPPFTIEMAERKGEINLMREFFKWCFRCSEHTLPALFLAYMQKIMPGKHTDEHLNTIEKFAELKSQFEDMLGENCVFIYPTHPETAPYHNQTILKTANIGYTSIFNCLGYPSTHSPLGLCKGLPFGIQTVGALFNDRLTIAVAVEIEKAFGGWISPSPIL